MEPFEERYWTGLAIGGILGLIAGLFTTLLINWQMGIPLGMIVMLVGSLIGGYSASEVQMRIKPNQGIYASGYNAVRVGLHLTLGLTIAFLLVWPYIRLAFTFGIMFGMAGGMLRFGGLAVVKHVVLRIYLTLSGNTPFNYAHFLDHAANMVIMRKVGGGYIFIHKTLQDYLATQYHP